MSSDLGDTAASRGGWNGIFVGPLLGGLAAALAYGAIARVCSTCRNPPRAPWGTSRTGRHAGGSVAVTRSPSNRP